MRLPGLLLLLLVSSSTHAGGDHFPVKLIEFDANDTQFSFLAIPIAKEKNWMDASCQEIKVTGTYNSQKWRNYKKPMSQENHLQAIAVLKDAFEKQGKVNFGHLGNGLKRISDCIYESHGLWLEERGVYSMYQHL